MGRCDTEGLSSILCVFCTCQERLGKWAVYRAVGPPDLFAGLADLLNTSASLFGLEKPFSSERHHPSLDRDFSFFFAEEKGKVALFYQPIVALRMIVVVCRSRPVVKRPKEGTKQLIDLLFLAVSACVVCWSARKTRCTHTRN